MPPQVSEVKKKFFQAHVEHTLARPKPQSFNRWPAKWCELKLNLLAQLQPSEVRREEAVKNT